MLMQGELNRFGEIDANNDIFKKECIRIPEGKTVFCDGEEVGITEGSECKDGKQIISMSIFSRKTLDMIRGDRFSVSVGCNPYNE